MQRVKARRAGKGPEAEADKFLELPAVEKCPLRCKGELVINQWFLWQLPPLLCGPPLGSQLARWEKERGSRYWRE